MSFATDKWFKHLREEILTEGLGDIGLSEDNISRIRMDMNDASEKARVWVGNALKSYYFKGYTSNLSVSLGRASLADRYYLVKMIQFAEMSRVDFLIKKGDREFEPYNDVVRTYLTEPVKKWPKARRSFVKQRSKFSTSDEVFGEALKRLDKVEGYMWSQFTSKIEDVIKTMNENPNNYTLIKGVPPSDLRGAQQICYEYQQGKEDPDQILHVFEDGSYWYDLETSRCNVEGERMGHCGTDDRGNLYSLRKRDKGKRDSKSYITIAFNEQSKEIFQIKGRSNTCPPESLWPHIEKFIELTDAISLQETGEYSNEPEEFNRLGDYLSSETGIEWDGSLDQRMEDFRNECNDYLIQFRANIADDEDVQLGGLDIEMDDYEEGFQWIDTLESIVVEVPFKLETRYLRGQQNDLGSALIEEILEKLEEEDRNSLINAYEENAEVSFLMADSKVDALSKTFMPGFSVEEKAVSFSSGSKTYMILDSLQTLSDEQIMQDLYRSQADNYDNFLDLVGELYNAVRNSVDAIENLLIREEIIKAPLVKTYKETIAKRFNNFYVKNTATNDRDQFAVMANGKLFDTTADEMETIVKTGLAPDKQAFNNLKPPLNLNRSGDGWWYSKAFKERIIEVLQSKERDAAKFAKRQMTLDYGEQYKEKIDNLWDKILSQKNSWLFGSDVFAGFLVKQSKPDPNTAGRIGQPIRMNEDAFFYKIEVNIDEQTIPIFGPFLEYYDNNFEIITGAFDKVVKEYIYGAAKRMKKDADTDDNLPDRWDANISREVVQQEAANPLDVRVYEMDFVMSYPLGLGFEITDIHNIMRAIPDVTTIRTIGNTKRSQGNRSISLQRLKFALQGQRNRREWVRKILLPQIHKISNQIRIHRIDNADLVSSSRQRLEESYYDSSMRQSTGRTTPIPSIESLIDDWVQGGVMYDTPTNINLTRYSVMMSVEDLKPYLPRQARKHGHHFDAGYQKFIEIGPRDPIYLAIGKNGRAKITGNEDDLRYAIKAGVEEVPVFISYQRQI